MVHKRAELVLSIDNTYAILDRPIGYAWWSLFQIDAFAAYRWRWLGTPFQ